MTDPVTAFKNTVVQLRPGEVHQYHVGHLGEAAFSSPTLAQIGMIARGLYLMGRVSLMQRRVKKIIPLEKGFETSVEVTEYSFKMLQPVHPADFDVARKTHLDSLV